MTVHEELFQAAATLNDAFKPRRNNETEQKYLSRLFGQLNYDNLPEEQYNAMSEAAQKWINEAQEAVDENNHFPTCPGLAGEDASEEAEAEADTDTEVDAGEAEDERADEEPATSDDGGEPVTVEVAEATEVKAKKPRAKKAATPKAAAAPKKEKAPAVKRAKKAATTEAAPPAPKKVKAVKPEKAKKNGDDSLTALIREFCIKHPGNDIDDVNKMLERKGLKASEGIVRTARYWTNKVMDDAKRLGAA